MKDIHIKTTRIKKELLIVAVCFAASVLLNIYSILKFETDWTELVSQLPVVLVISLVIYVLVLIFRLIFNGFKQLTKSK